MAYVQRDKVGKITAIFESQQTPELEQVALDDPELVSYLTHSTTHDDAKIVLAISDVELIRVLEDLINTLIDKNVNSQP